MKERWEERANKSHRIEWTITRDKETKTAKAVFYVLHPMYHAHPWTACSAMSTPEGKEISTYAFRMEPSQAAAQMRALKMASDWLQGKRLAGKKIIAEPVPDQREEDIASFVQGLTDEDE